MKNDTETWEANFNPLEFQDFQDGRWYTNVEKLKAYIRKMRSDFTRHHQDELAEVYREILAFIGSGHPVPSNDTGWSVELHNVEDFIKENAQSRAIDISDKKTDHDRNNLNEKA